MRSARQSLGIVLTLVGALRAAAGLQWHVLEGRAHGYILEYDVAGADGPEHVRFMYSDDRHWRRDVIDQGGTTVSIEAADGTGVWRIRRGSGAYEGFSFPTDDITGEPEPFGGAWGYWPGAISERQLARVLGEIGPPYMVSEHVGDDVVAGRSVVCLRYGQRGSSDVHSLCVDPELRAVLRYDGIGTFSMGTIEVTNVTVGVRLRAALFVPPPPGSALERVP